MASQDSFDDLLQCSICLERFTQPKLLPCAHTFCLSCLRGIVKDEKTVDCPTCRSPHQVPKEGVVGFKDNLVIRSLLDMVGEAIACGDCGKKQILSECEHCQQQVCGDCRVAHNILQTEISILIQSLEMGILKNPDDNIVQAAQTSVIKYEQVKTDVHAAFDQAIDVLNERREEMLQQIEIAFKIQNALAQGTGEAVVGDIREELSSCGSKEGLKRMKESLMRVEEMLSGELKFSYDVSGVARFGELRCGGETITKETTMTTIAMAAEGGKAKQKLVRKLGAGGDAVGAPRSGGALAVIAPHVENLGLVASGFHAADRFPARVDYQEKKSTWKRIISEPPHGCDKFAPTDTVFSQNENALYCLSSGKLLKFDIGSGVGKLICSLNAAHIALTDSESLLLINDRTLTRLSASSLANPETNYGNSLQTVTVNCIKAVQICSYRGEIAILDSRKKSLVKLNELGKLVQEIKLSPAVNEFSRMCVDRDGRIYVTSGVRITRKDNEDWNRDCTTCRVSLSVKVSWEVVISILTWDGEESGQLVDDGSKDYQCKLGRSGFECAACRSGEYNRCGGPSDDQIIRDIAVRGLCVDGDGYISVTTTGKNQIDVYDPKHKLFCTIGNKETPELKEPRGLTLMPDGRLVVCDTGNNRIQII